MSKRSIISAALLVSGTAIGAGMLALPVLTAQSGFWPGLMIFALCWLFMACTGLLFLEVALEMGRPANILSMAKHTLGVPGKAFSWVLYLFLFYAITVAYMAGGGEILATFSDGGIAHWQGILLFVLLFAPCAYLGTSAVKRVNVVLMVGLIATYLIFVVTGAPHIQPERLTRTEWNASLIALPVAFTAFGYQGIIPSLVVHMGQNAKKLRIAILLGSFLPFLVYAVWEALVLGIVPLEGPGGLQHALQQGHTAVYPLRDLLQSPWLFTVGQAFAFFALTSSFLGVSLGLTDFLIDGFGCSHKGLPRFCVALLVYLPPLAITLTYPNIFLQALDYAGGFGAALLLGLLPIAMVWANRYHKKRPSTHPLGGGRPLLIFLILVVLLDLAVELHKFF